MRETVEVGTALAAIGPPSAKIKGKERSSSVERRALTYSGVVMGKKFDLDLQSIRFSNRMENEREGKTADEPKTDIKHRVLLMLVQELSYLIIFNNKAFLPPKRRDLDADGIRFLEL
jgi:hypothetical protein